MIVIDEHEVENLGLELEEYLILLYYIKATTPIKEIKDRLTDKGFIIGDDFNTARLAEVAFPDISGENKYIDNLPDRDELKALADTLRGIVPQCKMHDTCYWYKCNSKEIMVSLSRFFAIYGSYPSEDIIRAVTEYVGSFNGDYTYMQLLKNFIFKIDMSGNYSSELASYLENK